MYNLYDEDDDENSVPVSQVFDYLETLANTFNLTSR